MKVEDQNRPQRTAARLPVGTGGEVERMWEPCACPGRDATLMAEVIGANRVATRTGRRGPTTDQGDAITVALSVTQKEGMLFDE